MRTVKIDWVGMAKMVKLVIRGKLKSRIRNWREIFKQIRNGDWRTIKKRNSKERREKGNSEVHTEYQYGLASFRNKCSLK